MRLRDSGNEPWEVHVVKGDSVVGDKPIAAVEGCCADTTAANSAPAQVPVAAAPGCC
ncbi:hypothetical protein [Actinoplanes sichuanensis]|uniref:Uncharacterized protein n=1 Tax=Actinoplanes sichuanensis TaxID=512349 RepID=A0ABW4A165_9ACTN